MFRWGVAPRDEFRFSRIWWEVSAVLTGQNLPWKGYAKGGELSPYYSDVELVLNAAENLREIKAALNKKYPYLNGNLSWVLHPENDYFEPGLTFGQRTKFLRMSVLPAGNFFSVAGKAVFGRNQPTGVLLQAVNTPSAQYLTYLRRERLSLDPQFQEGDVAKLPWPDFDDAACNKLNEWGEENTRVVRQIAKFDETDHCFTGISEPIQFEKAKVEASNTLFTNENDADALMVQCLQLAESDLNLIKKEISPKWNNRSVANWFEPVFLKDACSFSLGCAFGRWDIRYATGERQPPELPVPFDPLPVCPPAMLQNADGLPASPEDVPPNDYPLRITWSGILVDDDGHAEDIIARVRESLTVAWGDRGYSMEQEVCEDFVRAHPARLLQKQKRVLFRPHQSLFEKP